jgi:hypothetical protein
MMLNDLRAATIEQERIELVATNEVAPARDGMARPSVLHVAARPLPDRRWIGSRQELEDVPNRRAQPASAQLHARKALSVQHQRAQPATHENARALATSGSTTDYDGVEGLMGRYAHPSRVVMVSATLADCRFDYGRQILSGLATPSARDELGGAADHDFAAFVARAGPEVDDVVALGDDL